MLSVIYTGNTAPFHITQPPVNYVQIVTVTTVNVTCSLNITIPSTMIILWIHNNTVIRGDRVSHSTSGNTTTLLINNFQSSDVGDYQCIFNDIINSGWTIRRNIILNINGMSM